MAQRRVKGESITKRVSASLSRPVLDGDEWTLDLLEEGNSQCFFAPIMMTRQCPSNPRQL